jgi:signal transduction histidine kinase
VGVELSEENAVLSAAPPGRRERIVALYIAAASALVLVLAAPFARVQLAEIKAFLPAYQSALLITDLITGVLLYGQFARSRSLALLFLATGYLFDALMIIPHTLSFPGLLSATGLLGAGPQTTVWLYLFWHGGFVSFVLVYIVLRGRAQEDVISSIGNGVLCSVVGAILLVLGFVLLSTLGHDWLPVVIQGNKSALSIRKGIGPTLGGLAIVALLTLWRRRNRSILDLWLCVVLWAWFCDLLLSGAVGAARFDLGWYAGRAFGLLASSVLLVMLLVEVIALQTELLQSQRALARSRHLEALGQLTGGVAHDFNNLLTVVSGAADMIRRRADERARVTQWASSILTAAGRGASLTQQLLTFARRQSARPETVNANRLLAELKPLMRQAVGSDVNVALEMSSLIYPVRIDAAQFQSAILNLLVNARDAMPEGGKIIVRTENVTVSEPPEGEDAKSGEYICIDVRDTGVGMSSEVLAQAVNPFFTTKGGGLGSGLGLSQVYGFAKTFGGFLKIESSIGEGTAVEVYLPKSTDPLQSNLIAETLPVRRVRDAQESVLIVEDQAEVLSLAREALEELGYQVITASDAAEALNLLQQDRRIDVLFSDIVMPGGMNGVQLVMEARRIRPGIKVLLTSGYAPELLKARGIDADAVVLRKPYQRDDLVARLRVVSS